MELQQITPEELKRLKPGTLIMGADRTNSEQYYCGKFKEYLGYKGYPVHFIEDAYKYAFWPPYMTDEQKEACMEPVPKESEICAQVLWKISHLPWP